jgi:hypothetical protein
MKKVLELEYMMHTSSKILFPRLSTSNGMMGWFADKVHQNHNIFTFTWYKISNDARQQDLIENMTVKYQWLDELGYFEFKLSHNDMTGMTTLIVREYTDEDEIETAKNLWNSQIAKLKHMLGC